MPSIEEQLLLHEGYRRHPYKDTEGYWTIGIGRNLDTKGISQEEAKQLSYNDLKPLKERFKKCDWYNKLSRVRKKVILDMAFNLGISGFFQFKKMINAIKREDYVEASEEMLNSLWAEQVKNRADRLAKMMRTGQDYKN